MFSFEVTARDQGTRARTGIMRTRRGTVETPVFMPVGTAGTVKALSPDEVAATGARMILANTYHLYLRPGHEVVASLGGLHRFMGWDGPILTDSGGFQVFSLSPNVKVTGQGAEFRSHLDGSKHLLTPELAIDIQVSLGSDIMMVLDECTPFPADKELTGRGVLVSLEWARRCLAARDDSGQALFGIVQGGMFEGFRKMSAEATAEIGFDGYAIGGLSVGEPVDVRDEILAYTVPLLPEDKPVYLMGVGMPADIVFAVSQGVDMFDCVLPTRNARNGTLFTDSGRINIRGAGHAEDDRPVEEGCDCYTCRVFSRAYLRHLYHSRELLAYRLGTIHNLRHYGRLMERIREAIGRGEFETLKGEIISAWQGDKEADRERS